MADFIDEMRTLFTRLSQRLDHLETEEATKNVLILPFLQALGYNIFDTTEVVPEFTADFGTRSREKVDYPVLQTAWCLIHSAVAALRSTPPRTWGKGGHICAYPPLP
ncbi:MAG: hypothetical protein OXN21_06855 [Chloroflexota bacterium]|nr:hypothetical protein [Chloroflexota bacterium]